MKKILLTTVALFTLLLFFGCDPEGTNTQDDTNTPNNELPGDNEPDDNEPDNEDPFVGLVITESNITDLQVGFSVDLEIMVHFEDGRVVEVSNFAQYEDSDYGSVYRGVLTATAVGEDTITVTYLDYSAELTISTVDNYDSLEADVTEITNTIGSALSITFTAHKKDGTTEIVTEDENLHISETTALLYDNGLFKVMDSASETLTVKYASAETTITLNIPEYDFGERRYISDDDLLLRAVSYSGYRDGQSPGTQVYPSIEEIEQDLRLLKDAGFGFLRLYDTSTHARRTLEVIQNNADLDFKILLGVWIYTESETSNEENWVQINGALELAAPDAYGEIISAISVGNECMVDWNSWNPVGPQDMKKFIQYIRANVTQPVTTDDNWEPFSIGLDGEHAEYPDAVLPVAQVMDFVAIHTYPLHDSKWSLWDWEQLDVPEESRAVAMMDLGMQVAKDQYTAVREGLDNNGLTAMPIVIGETGWTHTNKDGGLGNRCHPVNAKMYYDRMMDWVYGVGRGEGPLSCFYFEAFDEPWKQGDDGWGLFDVNREAYYVLYAQENSPFPVRGNENYTEADAIYQPD